MNAKCEVGSTYDGNETSENITVMSRLYEVKNYRIREVWKQFVGKSRSDSVEKYRHVGRMEENTMISRNSCKVQGETWNRMQQQCSENFGSQSTERKR